MIPFKAKKRRFGKSFPLYLPTSWEELTFEQIAKIRSLEDDEPEKLLSILLQYDGRIAVEPFIPFLFWLATPIDQESIQAKPCGVDIGEKSYTQFIEFHFALEESQGAIASFPKLYSIYFGGSEKLHQKKRICEIVPYVKDLINQVEAADQKERDTLTR